MKITLVGAGLIEIPPKGWGAVESVIWDYSQTLENVSIVNEKDLSKCVEEIRKTNPDLVWVHDDRKVLLMDKIICPNKIITSHDPTLFNKKNPLLKYFVNGNFRIGCICRSHFRGFLKLGVDEKRLFMCLNGARSDLIRFQENPDFDEIICLGQLCGRKRQDYLAGIENVRFAGGVCLYDPPKRMAELKNRHLGSWNKDKVHSELTRYSALILISEFEASPLVVLEGLMSGLPVIVSERASENLPEKPFIKVLPERDILNPVLLKLNIMEFMWQKHDRKEIRKFAEENFDWKVLIKPLTQILF